MKRIILFVFIIALFINLPISVSAKQYSFSDLNNIDDGLDKIKDSLPGNISEEIVDIDEGKAEEIIKKYDIPFFFDQFMKSLKKVLPSFFDSLFLYIGVIALISISRALIQSLQISEISPILDFLFSLILALIIYHSEKSILNITQNMLTCVNETMSAVALAMEAIYISSGNITLSTVTGTGINLIISILETILSKILSPMLYTMSSLVIVSHATNNKAIKNFIGILKGFITTSIILIMTALTLVLSIQTLVSASSDNLVAKAARFALGSYIPIVGGAVSESFSLIQSSVVLLRDLCGITGIVVLILICLTPILSIMLKRFSLSVAAHFADILNCSSEKELFSELGGIYNILLAICISAVVMYILALSLFCKTNISGV